MFSIFAEVLYAVNGKNALGSVAVQGFVVSPDTGTLITTFVPDSPSVCNVTAIMAFRHWFLLKLSVILNVILQAGLAEIKFAI